MKLGSADFETLKKLEESLWVSKTRFDKAYMEEILSANFFEFGRSGRIYNREQCINVKPEAINIKLPLKDFKITSINNQAVLITYVSQVDYETLEISNRSSTWIKTAESWQLQFHQGTAVN